MKISAEPIAAKRIAASVEPITVPVPPRIETPPITEAVMMVSSRLGGTVDWMTWSCVAKRIAAMPAKTPWIAKTCTIVARSGCRRRAPPRHCRRRRRCERPKAV